MAFIADIGIEVVTPNEGTLNPVFLTQGVVFL